jgi:hypothetical protein
LVSLALVSKDPALSGEFDQLYFFLLARFKSHGSSRGNIQPHASRPHAFELQRIVHFEKVIMAADLNRPVAGVPDRNLNGPAARISLDRLRF